jgi:hypothetical protein
MDANVNAIVDGFQETFESQVLICTIRSLDFFQRFQGVICLEPDGETRCSDFSNPIDNVVYRAIRAYRKATASSKESIPSHQDLAGLLFLMSYQGDINDTERDMAVARVHELLAAPGMSPELVATSVGHWIKKTRAQKITVRASSGLIQMDDLLSQLQQNADVINGSTGNKTRYTFKEAMKKSQESDVQRYPMGIPAVDAALGGGFAKGEFTLVPIPSGGGKTVLACNLVTNFSRQGLKGILITTEQGPDELMPRFISAGCEIPFSAIKDGVKLDKLNAEQQTRIHQFQDILEEHVVLVDWGKSDHDAATEIPNEIRNARKKLGQVDYVILDWIGGSLGAAFKGQLDKLRLIFKRTADSLDQHAKNENVFTIGFAQTTPSLSHNKRKIDRTMVGECKTMHERATNVIGVSALQEDTEEGSGKPNFLLKQWFNLDKSRKSVGGCVPVKRDFAYQRFTTWGRD